MIPSAIESELRAFLHVLQSRWGKDLVSVVLFGSWARGDTRAESDIDLLVIRGHFPTSRLARHEEMFKVAKAVSEDFAAQVSIVPLTLEEARETKPFYLGMLTAHVILHDRGAFFTHLLQRLQKRLKELGSERRVDADGYEYWVLKPDLKLGEAVRL
jgi:hypothetical protein